MNISIVEESLGLLVAGSCGYFGYLRLDGTFLPYVSIEAIKARHIGPELKQKGTES